uniref:Guanine nucleotide-binding protein subunit gamma n=1 Tax=Canis lupus familiaris TaxID=9615 RepID=A0A8P0S7W3_CANLF
MHRSRPGGWLLTLRLSFFFLPGLPAAFTFPPAQKAVTGEQQAVRVGATLRGEGRSFPAGQGPPFLASQTKPGCDLGTGRGKKKKKKEQKVKLVSAGKWASAAPSAGRSAGGPRGRGGRGRRQGRGRPGSGAARGPRPPPPGRLGPRARGGKPGRTRGGGARGARGGAGRGGRRAGCAGPAVPSGRGPGLLHSQPLPLRSGPGPGWARMPALHIEDLPEKEKLKMEVEQLRKEVKLQRQQVSKCSEEIKNYIEERSGEDPLVKGIPEDKNPFKEKGSCIIS